MKNLIDIYVHYELGEIAPENLPNVVIEFIEKSKNEYLLELACMHNPLKLEIDPILLKAFEIPLEKKMNQYEKIELIINWYENDKLPAEKVLPKIYGIESKFLHDLENIDYFTNNFYNMSLGRYIPSDSWDFGFDELKKEILTKNGISRYSEYLINNTEGLYSQL